MYCPECGKKISNNVKYCPECGEKIARCLRKKAAPVYIVKQGKIIDEDRDNFLISHAPDNLTGLGIFSIFDIVYTIIFIIVISTTNRPEASMEFNILFAVFGLIIGIPQIVFWIKSLAKANCINRRIGNSKGTYLTMLILPFAFSMVLSILMILTICVPDNAIRTAYIVFQIIGLFLTLSMAVHCFSISKKVKKYVIEEGIN